MIKAWREVGLRRLVRFLWVSILLSIFRRTWVPPIRAAFLRLCGARIGRDTIVHRISFINVDRGGFRNLQIGDSCFIGDEAFFDLAAPIVLEDQVGIGQRVMLMTHMNVGYRVHPLQARFPPLAKGITVRRATFVGAGAMILAGCEVGPEAFISARAVVTRNVGAGEIVRAPSSRPAGPEPA
jgi:acetyltransferase-like isoleucine patch superfamily enzyme